MEINTNFFGQISYSDKNIITFESGIPGFESLRNFALIEVEDISDLTCLQSIDDENVCFFMMSPASIVGNYDIKVDDSVIDELDLKSPEEAELYSILNIPDEIKNATANLKCPIIINSTNKKAVQGLLKNTEYEMKHKVMASA